MTEEGDIKKTIKAKLRALGVVYYMVPQGAYCTPGAPDMVIIVNGHTFHTEVKTKTGRLEEDQKRMQRRILEQGADYVVVRSAEDVINMISPYLPKKV